MPDFFKNMISPSLESNNHHSEHEAHIHHNNSWAMGRTIVLEQSLQSGASWGSESIEQKITSIDDAGTSTETSRTPFIAYSGNYQRALNGAEQQILSDATDSGEYIVGLVGKAQGKDLFVIATGPHADEHAAEAIREKLAEAAYASFIMGSPEFTTFSIEAHGAHGVLMAQKADVSLPSNVVNLVSLGSPRLLENA